MAKTIDCTGKRYGNLVGIEFVGWSSQNQRIWRWRCDCGTITEKVFSRVNCGDTKSCGCLKRTKGRQVHNRLATGEAALNVYYAAYQYRAAKKGLEFALTREQFKTITSANCAYCGTPPTQEVKPNKKVHGAYTSNGIDRVDNTVGYSFDNVVPCCYPCNRAKGSMTTKAFLEWMQRLVAHQTIKPQ